MQYVLKTLPNGLRVIACEMPNTDTVTVLTLIGTGSHYETKEINGISHFLEHIPKGDSYNAPIYQFMDEIYRILKPGGLARFISPYYTSVRAFQDPTHHQFISEPLFNYFNKGWRELNKLTHYPVKCDFEIVKLDHAVSEEYTGKAQDAVAYSAMHMWNVIMDLQIILRKPKLTKK